MAKILCLGLTEVKSRPSFDDEIIIYLKNENKQAEQGKVISAVHQTPNDEEECQYRKDYNPNQFSFHSHLLLLLCKCMNNFGYCNHNSYFFFGEFKCNSCLIYTFIAKPAYEKEYRDILNCHISMKCKDTESCEKIRGIREILYLAPNGCRTYR